MVTRPILPVSQNRDLRPSFAQQRLWFLDQLEVTGAAFHFVKIAVREIVLVEETAVHLFDDQVEAPEPSLAASQSGVAPPLLGSSIR